MDDADRALEILKFHIKKEIVDNYFAERVYLEHDLEALHQAAQAYREKLVKLSRGYHALYQALGAERAISRLMTLLGLMEAPFWAEFQAMPAAARAALLKGSAVWGFTARQRQRRLAAALYEELEHESDLLQEEYDKIQTHLKLLNQDINKFNMSFDFGLIAAQIEAMEGRQEPIGAVLMAEEREELSTRMRFKRQKLTDQELPPVPPLPRFSDIKAQLMELADWSA
jgi:hypothetical protein